MTPTEKAKRAEALYYDNNNITRRTLCHMIVNLEADLKDAEARNTQLREARETCRDEGDPGDFCCSECGVRMFTDTNDTYTIIAGDERTIIKHPNFCPNCGRRVVDE